MGGSGNNGDDDLLADRPVVLPAYLSSENWSLGGADPGPIVVEGGGGGGVHDGTGVGPGRWISTASIRVTAAVDSMTIAGQHLAVP